jgi:hypothetical protein
MIIIDDIMIMSEIQLEIPRVQLQFHEFNIFDHQSYHVLYSMRQYCYEFYILVRCSIRQQEQW